MTTDVSRGGRGSQTGRLAAVAAAVGRSTDRAKLQLIPRGPRPGTRLHREYMKPLVPSPAQAGVGEVGEVGEDRDGAGGVVERVVLARVLFEHGGNGNRDVVEGGLEQPPAAPGAVDNAGSRRAPGARRCPPRSLPTTTGANAWRSDAPVRRPSPRNALVPRRRPARPLRESVTTDNLVLPSPSPPPFLDEAGRFGAAKRGLRPLGAGRPVRYADPGGDTSPAGSAGSAAQRVPGRLSKVAEQWEREHGGIVIDDRVRRREARERYAEYVAGRMSYFKPDRGAAMPQAKAEQRAAEFDAARRRARDLPRCRPPNGLAAPAGDLEPMASARTGRRSQRRERHRRVECMAERRRVRRSGLRHRGYLLLATGLSLHETGSTPEPAGREEAERVGY